jgi:hypothetical protein
VIGGLTGRLAQPASVHATASISHVRTRAPPPAMFIHD